MFTVRLRREIEVRKGIEVQLRLAIEDIEKMRHRASHELRGPLASSLGFINTIKKTFYDEKMGTALSGMSMAEKSLEDLLVLVDGINAQPYLNVTKREHT